eukprot:sb/3466719/
MRDEVDIAGRLQLYEFFDIIPLSTYISNISIHGELNSGTAKDSQMLYKIDNFYNFLFTHDEKIKTQLDKDYKALISRAIRAGQPPKTKERGKIIESTAQKAVEVESRSSFRDIRQVLRHSNNIIALSRSGQMSKHKASPEPEARTEVSQISPSIPSRPGTAASEPSNMVVPPLISKKDLERQNALIEDLHWEMLNSSERHAHSLDKILDELKAKKAYRETRTIFSASAARRTTADVYFGPRGSTANDPFDAYSIFDDDISFPTTSQSLGVIGAGSEGDEEGENREEDAEPLFVDITATEEYQKRKNSLLKRAETIKKGHRERLLGL